MKTFAASLSIFAIMALPSPATSLQLPPQHQMRSPKLMLAQAGSTGGTIGKQGKSVSGGEERQPRQPAASAHPPQRASCPNIVGVWNSWASGLFGKADTTFNSNGTAVHRSGIPGTWKCEGGQLVMIWGSSGRVEHFTLSPDRKKIVRSDGAVGFSRD